MPAGGTNGLTSIIVVAADSGPLLERCLSSALALHGAIELILVDNASRDGSVEAAMAVHADDARLRLLQNPQNLGFGPACNRGAAVARGDAFLFLNPDCELAPDVLPGMLRLLARGSGIGLLGLTIRNPDGSIARGNRRREPTLRRAFMSLSGLARHEARWPALAGIEMPQRRFVTELEEVEATSGAVMLVPRTAFASVGGFDEGYFLHAEDLDLCHRLRAVGWRVAVAGLLEATHAQGSSSHHRPLFVARHKRRSFWRYFTKFDPAARNPLLRALVWSGLWAQFGVRVLLAPPASWFRKRREARAGDSAPAA